MTSNELKHQAKVQEWGLAIQGLPKQWGVCAGVVSANCIGAPIEQLCRQREQLQKEAADTAPNRAQTLHIDFDRAA